MEYTNITSLVPEGEQFDSTAVNEGVWVTERHLQNVENRLLDNVTEIAASQEQINGLTEKLEDQALQAQQAVSELATANETIATKDTEIARLNARITALENETPDPAQTKKDVDETGSNKKVEVNPLDAIADNMMGIRKPKEA